ncbi:MAG TPA: thiamine phosphate synthase [Candidatus Dormibacteraeota bacterium]
MNPSSRQSALAGAHLYAITPDEEPERLLELSRAVLGGGADVLQLRHKTLPRGRLLELAIRLREITAEAGRLFIVNDHVDIALLVDADGVQLGDDDLSLPEARRLAGAGFLIGASANQVESARQAVKEGADYVGCGPAFATPIKAVKPVVGPGRAAELQSALGVPVFAIGGVQPENLDQVVASGVRRACMIRGLFGAADPEAAARRSRAILTE